MAGAVGCRTRSGLPLPGRFRLATPASRPAATSGNSPAGPRSVRLVNNDGRGKRYQITPGGNHLRCLLGFLPRSCHDPEPRAQFLPALRVAVRGGRSALRARSAGCRSRTAASAPSGSWPTWGGAVQELAPPPAQELYHTHQRPLTLLCHRHGVLVCTACVEHRADPAVPLEEAARWYRKQFEASLKTFQEEDKRHPGLTEAAKETRQEMLTRVSAEKQKLQAMLKGLHRVLSDQESWFLSWLHRLCWRLEEQQRGEADEMTWIQQCCAELQAKCQQLDGDLLRDPQTTLRRYRRQKASPRTPVLAPNPPFLGSSSHPAFFFLWDFCFGAGGVDG
ncbi:E3 ubiquitin-protein ligase TRIM11-like [Corvus kubaryi]|uniref:E3 ubiquitin-protein ligase TRIM11-like n=1 Tax=Corvus kubaryi TaxID=68294 RepID=UPI001C049F3E|nr:E3 ubiquitin-protein ligase TRIM11-like [Corvus kubaryi]